MLIYVTLMRIAILVALMWIGGRWYVKKRRSYRLPILSLKHLICGRGSFEIRADQFDQFFCTLPLVGSCLGAQDVMPDVAFNYLIH